MTEASVKEKKQEYDEAFKCSIEAIDYFRHAIRYEACTEKTKSKLRSRCFGYIDRAEKLKKYINEKKREQKDELAAPISNGEQENKHEMVDRNE